MKRYKYLSYFELYFEELLADPPKIFNLLLIPAKFIHSANVGIRIIELPTPQCLKITFGEI